MPVMPNAPSILSLDAEVVQTESVELTVIGAGAWGSALASLVQKNNHTVRLWSRRSEISLGEAVDQAQVILSAVSMKGVPSVVAQLRDIDIPPETILVTATKGLDPETTRTPSQMIQAAFPDNPVVVLSGPNLSKEIEQGQPAATVAASLHPAAAEAVQYLFSSDTFRVYSSPDPLGAELGGTLKNVIAIAVGVCEGLNLGANARSALITRALPEVIRIGTHLGGQPETFFGLSGLGDMLATCTSVLSRNYRVGYGLAQGKPLAQILEELGSTAEGVNTTQVLVAIANREGIPVPIARQVHRLLLGKITPQEAVEALMERDLKPEACDL
ncbi:NAD(P)H-dependent glycerol-3-phosphate dehydrogenase [Leptolyngbya sp. PCC 6406]|uniref:NAD(P)H-dependent glycerol-3-phosphate dehydrogenase n=1 Tax=Leptolyngbya sp. PCC 6406 TaxID=1173264 RepID=UPI0002ACA549|nr:NAD(P)H-dependent glycerol-3-phosphate dehydrogenase [Leptolyngbya sp. PCC 6406]